MPGVGRPSYGGTRPEPALIRLTGTIGADIGWLYVLDPDADIVTVYEATVHDRWLRHSLHFLGPRVPSVVRAGLSAEARFVSGSGPEGGLVAAMTECTVRGAVDEIAHHEMPSILGHDTSTPAGAEARR